MKDLWGGRIYHGLFIYRKKKKSILFKCRRGINCPDIQIPIKIQITQNIFINECEVAPPPILKPHSLTVQRPKRRRRLVSLALQFKSLRSEDNYFFHPLIYFFLLRKFKKKLSCLSPGFQCPQSWWGGLSEFNTDMKTIFFFFFFFLRPPKKPFPLTVFAVPSKTWNLSWGCVFMLNKDPFPNETLRILQRGLHWSLTDSTSLDERRDNQKDAALLRCQLPTPTSWCVGLVKGRFCSRGNRSKKTFRSCHVFVFWSCHLSFEQKV